MDTLIPPLVSAATIATLLQLIKNSPFIPWINRDTGRLNAILSVIAAGLTAFGLSFDGSFDDATGAFTLGFHGTLAGMIDGIAHWIGQWTAQHTIYKGIIAPAEIQGETRAILKAMLGQAPQIKHEVPPTAGTAGTGTGTGGI